MKTAIITGASSGLGREFALQLSRFFPDIECCWLIARRGDRLAGISKDIKPAVPLALDLTGESGIAELKAKLSAGNADVRLLINCAGRGFCEPFDTSDIDGQLSTVDLNVRALTAVTHTVLPYIGSGGRIINISSIASFVPNANMTVYSATKAYVSFFSRALREELLCRNISVTYVCPGPMDTEFLALGGADKSKTFHILPYCIPEKVAAGAYKASIKRKAVFTPRAFYKFYRVLSGILPHAWLIKLAKT